MMFRIKIVFLFLFLVIISGTNLNAQGRITIAPQAIDDDGLNYNRVLGYDGEGVYVLHSNLSLETNRDRIGLRTRKYRISYHNEENLIPKWAKNLQSHPEDASIEVVGFYNGKVTVLNSIWDRQKNKFRLYIDIYDETGNLYKSGINLKEFNIEKSSALSKPRMLTGNMQTDLGIFFEEIRGNEQKVYYTSCDTALNVKQSLSGIIPYSEKALDITEIVQTEKNELLILGTLPQDPESGSKRQRRLFHLFLLSELSGSVKEYKVSQPDNNMLEAAIGIDRINRKAVVTGFYADKESFAGAGILFGSLSLDNPDEWKIISFPVKGDAQLKLVGERNSGGSISLISYPIRKVILRSDGGAVVIAEGAYLSEFSYYDYFTQSFNRRIEYHYDNVVIFSVNATGGIDWSQVIRKEQTSVDDEGQYSSFALMTNQAEISLIYNSDIGRNNEVAGHIINNKGKAETRKLSNTSDNISILPRAGIQTDANTLVIPAVTRKKLYLAKITL